MISSKNRNLHQLRVKLREHFGFQKFRRGQAVAVHLAIDGLDTLVVMPTGSGKSLCFQMPGLEREGTAIVVSPLISLMKDQADHLRQFDIRVTVVNSTLSEEQRRATLADIIAGQFDYIYTTPEQLADPDFRIALARQPISLFVVDEAHCISQWGHDFRPDYLALGEAIEALDHPPVMALTASATPEVEEDILQLLHIPDAAVVHTGFYRENIALSVVQADGDEGKQHWLLDYLHRAPGTGIIYAATVQAVTDLRAFLSSHGISADRYHGRLNTKIRTYVQNSFIANEYKTLVATNAFGLGIDKPDIRFVIHYHMPGRI
jgi:ATP-dependent DNA helicase RecQ